MIDEHILLLPSGLCRRYSRIHDMVKVGNIMGLYKDGMMGQIYIDIIIGSVERGLRQVYLG